MSTVADVPRLLLVEDEAPIREAVGLLLRDAGFDVLAVPDAPDPATVPWDQLNAVVLDVGLPSVDGITLCKEIRRRSNVPVVMLTASDAPADVVAGLEAGADDYVTKPCDPDVLVARIRAATRRHEPSAPGTLVVRDLVVDEVGFTTRRGDEDLGLSATEMRLLIALARQPGTALRREDLLDQVWGYDYLGDSRLVDMAVLRLRQKLGEPTDGGGPYIATVRSVGYRLDV